MRRLLSFLKTWLVCMFLDFWLEALAFLSLVFQRKLSLPPAVPKLLLGIWAAAGLIEAFGAVFLGRAVGAGSRNTFTRENKNPYSVRKQPCDTPKTSPPEGPSASSPPPSDARRSPIKTGWTKP